MLLVFESQINDAEELISILKKNGADAIFDESKTYGSNHISMALYHTIQAFKNKSNYAEDFSLEFLIRLSGEKQISKALAFGIKNGISRIGIITNEENKDKIIEILGRPVAPGKYDKDFIIEYFEIKDINNRLEIEKKIFEKIALLNTKL
ncbi:MAG: Regulatory protein [Candidatus Methanofastidiosum methylothiophilum]|uniref:Regulatory protein n=1 Tax=Candidatus Methanofastidiosum methylothiophilum TaxID=1705564 RepID=A0A150IQI5_9EURY|nr:MAG: Regulatory protein [Candidatus Methanofastidiosum methylthiophilus]KYC47309.1 MAG: Regulatory protein [Candidatus Methanofastidiosum methylthiophilus]KYC48866.1 MAG: Regulatory protein [Candidatus Methanofastidiosum methylthiophilus]